jgi:hypothetical protein
MPAVPTLSLLAVGTAAFGLSDRQQQQANTSLARSIAEALLGDLRCSYNYKYLFEGREKEEGGEGG